MMKHSELNTNQNNFGIQISSREINNKSFSLAEQGISASNQNSNTLMINSVIPAHININSSAILSSTLNNQRSINLPEVKNYNLAILAKPNNSSNASISSNLVNPLNTIKLVNLSKCQQISNINKDNAVQNNTINVQFVSNTSNNCSDATIPLQPSCKIDTITLNHNSMTTSATNSSISTNSTSLGGTRFVIQGASQFLHQGTVTFIPQTSDMINNSISNNHLIKNPKFVFTGNKQHQSIRPISTTGSASFVVTQSNISKQTPISIISPSKSTNNIGSISNINMLSSDVSNQTILPDPSVNHTHQLSATDSKRCLKNTPPMKIPLQSYSVSTNNSNNIRLALTSNINNSRVNAIQSKIQLISPKSRKRSGSPLNVLPERKIKNPSIGSKDENIDNSINYNNQLGNYSPTRKRARKQHLKAVNTKSQKLICTQKLLFNCKIEPTINIRPVLNDKIIPTTVVSTSGTKVTNVSFQNKSDENLTSIPTPINNPINAQIIIGIKNSIQPCPSKISSTSQSLSQKPSIYTNNSGNNIIANNSNTINTSATITPISQFQIISQNQNIKPIQLSPNFIFSPKIKYQTPFSPSKVIHIAPSISSINRTTPVKSEIVVPELISTNTSTDDKHKFTKERKKKSVEPVKAKMSEVKLESSEETNFKMSLFPMKYHWNPRRNHFIKKSDLKFKKSKSSSCNKLNNLSGSEMQEDCSPPSCDNEFNDINWLIFKTFSQILMQKTFDEENLQEMYRLREKFEITLPIDDLSIPVFQKMCSKTKFYSPLPDQIDSNCLSKYTDPHLFGISDDIIDNYVNSLTKSDSEIAEADFLNTESHECTAACVLYSLEVSPSSQPKKINKIIDLIEGIIVKEKNIIEKESEISNQFVKFIRHTSDFTLQNKKLFSKTNNHTDRFKWLTTCRR